MASAAPTDTVCQDGSSSSQQDEKKVKGILKNKQLSHEHPEVRWDEMNILETYHPANKNYGHMKIDEPPTPYNHEFDDETVKEDVQEDVPLNADNVAAKLMSGNLRDDFESDLDSDNDDDLSDAAKTKKNVFKKQRAKHYDEGSNIKKARELIAKEMAELESNGDMDAEMDTSK